MKPVFSIAALAASDTPFSSMRLLRRL